ncbi:MAG: alpha/beta hydrolase [Alphaproteobacteria bacterium]|nr:alpha/beta hydrolase [Alphaproteobacteria bacterium]
MTDFRERRYELPTTGLHAFEAGDGAPVIFLHGLTGTAGVWEPVALRVARRNKAIAIDQRGHGRSGRPAGEVYAAEHYAADIAALIDALGQGPAVLVGHSLGARNAIVAAARHPDKIRGVVAVDLVPFIPESEWIALETRVGGGDRAFATDDEVRTYLAGRYPLMPADAIARRVRYGYVRRADGLRPLADASAMMATCRGFRPDFVADFRANRVATVLVRGEHSAVVDRDTWAKARALRPDLAAIEVAGTDHYVNEERPELVGDIVEGFIAGLGRAAAKGAHDIVADGIRWSVPVIVRRDAHGGFAAVIPDEVAAALAIAEGDVVNFTAFPTGAIEFWSIKKSTYSSLEDEDVAGRLARESRP